MKTKPELKHLAPYLPYGLKIGFEGGEHTHDLVGLQIGKEGVMLISPFYDFGRASTQDCRPILRPLSDLTKEIEHNGERFVPLDEMHTIHYPEVHFGDDDFQDQEDIKYCPWWVMQHLFEWHFDVFGLIDAGLAIDINTLEQ